MSNISKQQLSPHAFLQFTKFAAPGQWSPETVTDFTDQGWTMNGLGEGLTHGLKTPADFRGVSLWSKRYLVEGHLWGDDPSETCLLANDKIERGPIAEIGSGYGRDAWYMAQRRDGIIALEKSRIGCSIISRKFREGETQAEMNNRNFAECHVVHGSARTFKFGKDSLSGIFSHRTLHLPHPDTSLEDIVRNMTEGVRPGGKMVVGVRSIHDYYQDQDKMHLITKDDNGFPMSAEYKDRPGHVINYFTPERFKDVFGPYCQIEELWLGKEPESSSNKDINSYYLTGVMTVLPDHKHLGKVDHAGNGKGHQGDLPHVQKLKSIPIDENIACTPICDS
jgi:hypothetical protein